MPKEQPETKIRTCNSCEKEYEYPIKGSKATRHFCEQCFAIPLNIRKTFQRLNARIRKLEKALAHAREKK